ncbi:MAG: hypothetical protein GIX03_10405 [Candidatus Eremiobacteraeota bacterium]|nr:hypothetical protein [Candidatus Eremiobacteraeota bacterium]MBC5804997.1 hypothetical protein [Candidatus Eremiobacteraeota bacterium]MBC5820676.1 hypothetical protein [Candidatus Eremiobacteraeota bacterium]
MFDPIIERDLPFAISPRLLETTTVPELLGAHGRMLRHFSDVMALLEQAASGDALWRAALDLFDFLSSSALQSDIPQTVATAEAGHSTYGARH